jgi:putative transposase
MARLARVVIPGLPHHVTQRGNRRAPIFFSDEDRVRYLSIFAHYARRYALRVFAYCLMDNHVHWVVVPNHEDALAATFRETHAQYAGSINRTASLSGHLFQGRFFSCPLDDEHLWAAVRYVERNPLRAGIVQVAEHYAWSSAAAHCASSPTSILCSSFPPRGAVQNWSEWLTFDNEQHTAKVRRHTQTGRPCGSTAFVAQLEQSTNRVFQPLKRGRKSQLPAPTQGELFHES